MTYNFKEQKIERMGKHGYLGVSLIVRETDGQERMMLRSQLNRIPFLWSEAAGDAYYSQLFFPLDTGERGARVPQGALKALSGDRAEMFLLDQTQVRTFTISLQSLGRRKPSLDIRCGRASRPASRVGAEDSAPKLV